MAVGMANLTGKVIFFKGDFHPESRFARRSPA